MKGIWRRFTRWRHGRGFGIHSPLAYDLVMSTLRCRYGYYGDAIVDSLFTTADDRRRGRALLRTVARFNPARVAYGKGLDSRWAVVVSQTAKHAKIVSIIDEADLYVTTDPAFEPPGQHCSVTVYLCRHHGPYRRDDAQADVDLRMGPVAIDNERDMAVAIRRRGLTAKTIFAKF